MEMQKSVYNWVDVTKEFIASAGSLPAGSLVKDSCFSLYDAMSAIELMDPKMDAGMLCNKELCKVGSITEALEAGMFVDNPSLKDIIGISDEILSCITTWLEGHSLAQTVLTCLYVHRVSSIKSPYLSSICNAVLKVCELINYIISSAESYEEEDFLTCTYGFDVSPKISSSKVIQMLKDGEDEINKRIKRNETISEDEMAILHRLKFWKYFVLVLSKVQRFEHSNMESLKNDISTLFHSIQPVMKTLNMGTQPVVSTSETGQKSKNMIGFEYLINQRLLSSTPPRYISIMEHDASCEYLLRLFAHLDLMTSISDCTTLSGIIRFFVKFSEQTPSVLPRSCLYYIVLSDSKFLGDECFVKFVKDEVRNFSHPVSFFTPFITDRYVKDIVDKFLDEVSICIQDYIHAMSHNKGRQRRKLGGLLSTLGRLYSRTEEYDTLIHNYITSIEASANHIRALSCWVLFITVEVMIKYLLLGWELELYQIHESHYVYCYLEHLFSWLRQTVLCGQTLIQSSESLEKKLVKRYKNMKKKKREKNHNMVLQMTNVYQMLSHGYIKAMEGFAIQGKLDEFLNKKYDNEHIRFRQRFAPLSVHSFVISYLPLDYNTYVSLSHVIASAKPGKEYDLFKESLEYFKSVKSVLDKIPQEHSVEFLSKVVKMNCVQMGLAINGHNKDSGKPPILDFSICQNVPFIKVV